MAGGYTTKSSLTPATAFAKEIVMAILKPKPNSDMKVAPLVVPAKPPRPKKDVQKIAGEQKTADFKLAERQPGQSNIFESIIGKARK